MRQVFLEKGVIAVKEVSEPVLDEGSVLVGVQYSFISSGTEAATISHAKKSLFFSDVSQKVKKVFESISAHGFDGTKALIKGKVKGQVQTLGYSCSGKVLAVGKNVKTVRVGDFVACAGAGLAHHAEVVCVPENLVVRLESDRLLKEASLTTIGAIALQGIRRAQLQLGETVCVIGLGLLGQITVQLAKLSGCKVVGLDLKQERLDIARRLGAEHAYNPSTDSVRKEIEFWTKHHGVDCSIITAASQSSMIVQQAMEVTRKKGKVVVVGDVGLHLERNPFYTKEIDFLVSCSYGPGRYDPAYEERGLDYPYPYVRWTENRNMQAFMALVEQGKISTDELISETATIDTVNDAYQRLQEGKSLGIILAYETAPKIQPAVKENKVSSVDPARITFMPASRERLRVGFIGGGGFAKVKLMPIVSQLKNVSVEAVVDTNVSNALNLARLYGAPHAFADYHKLFEKDLVDAVVIASPHKYHCDQALAALRQGKAVFVEKPMAVNSEQLDRMKQFLKEHPDIPFCVDYNRSFSPFIRKIQSTIARRHSPIVAHYRMNAGFIPKEHWVQTDVGAGRIIGEACHIIDLFCSLTQAQPAAVSVESLRPSSDDLFPTDNFSVQISFDDGSVCSLVYTALGHSGLGKERMELFFDSKSIVLDDYLVLEGFGVSNSFDETVHAADKGHSTLLRSFFDALTHKKSMPVSLDHLMTVAELTLLVDRLACQGGGTYDMKSAGASSVREYSS